MECAQIETLIRETIRHHVNPKECYVFLFGSRAAGAYSRTADFDIGLYTGQKIPFTVIAKIMNELEEYPIPVRIDIVDFAAVSSEFKKIALKEIEIWNRPKKSFKLI